MNGIKLVVLVILGIFFPLQKAHAIIFIPAVILIPIAHIIAVILGGLSIPVVGFGVLWNKLFHTPPKRIVAVLVPTIIIGILLIAVVLKVLTPERPLF